MIRYAEMRTHNTDTQKRIDKSLPRLSSAFVNAMYGSFFDLTSIYTLLSEKFFVCNLLVFELTSEFLIAL